MKPETRNQKPETLIGTISVEGMHFFSRHGVYEEERDNGNWFVVDVYIKADISTAAESDHIEDTVNYEKVYEKVAEIMGGSVRLLEHLAARILEEVEPLSPRIHEIKVRVSKNEPPLAGDVDRTFVEIKKEVK